MSNQELLSLQDDRIQKSMEIIGKILIPQNCLLLGNSGKAEMSQKKLVKRSGFAVVYKNRDDLIVSLP